MKDIKYRKFNGESFIYCILKSKKHSVPCCFFEKKNIHFASQEYFWTIESKEYAFTGIYDKNGEEIYEGSIVKIKDNYSISGFTIKTVTWWESGAWNIFNISPVLIEVVGNIDENKVTDF